MCSWADGMTTVPYGQGERMLSMTDLCAWLNITEGHARKLVERDAIPYRKVGHLIRFPEAEIEEWSHPAPKQPRGRAERRYPANRITPGRSRVRSALPKSLID